MSVHRDSCRCVECRLDKVERRLAELEKRTGSQIVLGKDTWNGDKVDGVCPEVPSLNEQCKPFWKGDGWKPSPEKQADPVNCKTICDACGEYDYDCTCKQPAKVEQISISMAVAEEVLRSGFDLPNELYDELKKALGQ